MRKKVLITVGGTGGHVYPALAVARKLKSSYDILFVGGGLKKNRYFKQEEFDFKETTCGTISLRKPLMTALNVGKIIKGIWQARCLIKNFSPDVVIGFGSYHTLPLLIAAKLSSIPIILHEANRVPGKVNRLFSPYALITGVHFPDTPLKGKKLEIKMPLRDGYSLGHCTKEDALAYFGLLPNRQTILVFGGSQGAVALNKVASDAVVKISSKYPVQVLHFAGEEREASQLQKKYEENGVLCCVKAFETRMDLSWQAADVMISRSGAGTIAEEIEFEVPGILIPYPHAMDNHQEANADFVVKHVQGAIKCLERELNSDFLSQQIEFLLKNESENLKKMKRSIRQYKEKNKSNELYDVVKDTLC